MEGMILITNYKLRITNHGKFDWAFAYGNSITAVYFLMHQHFYFDGNYTNHEEHGGHEEGNLKGF